MFVETMCTDITAFFFLMTRPPPRPTRLATRLPYPPLSRPERRPPQPTRRKPAMFKGSALLGSPALPKHPSTLGGKVAVVTGSTSGIGLGIAQALARLGADIVLNGFGEHSEKTGRASCREGVGQYG